MNFLDDEDSQIFLIKYPKDLNLKMFNKLDIVGRSQKVNIKFKDKAETFCINEIEEEIDRSIASKIHLLKLKGKDLKLSGKKISKVIKIQRV